MQPVKLPLTPFLGIHLDCVSKEDAVESRAKVFANGMSPCTPRRHLLGEPRAVERSFLRLAFGRQ
jgi:hypothetical protein